MSSERNLTDRDIELLSAYLDDALSSEERAALDARLTAEPVLRRELGELRQTVALVHDFGRMSAPRNFTLTAAMVRPPRILFFPATATVSFMSAVAAIVLVAAGALLLARPVPSVLTASAPVAQTRQIAFAPTATTALGNASDGLFAAQTEAALDKVTQDTNVPADQIVTGGMAEATAETTLNDAFFGVAPTEEPPALGYAARSAMPTFEGDETEQQAQADDQPSGDADLAAASSAASANAAEAAAPAPMMAASGPQGTPTELESMTMQMAAPSQPSENGGAGAASAAIIVEQPSETPTETATASPTASATLTLTPTPTATATFTPVPSATPAPTTAPLIEVTGGTTGLAGLVLIVAGAAALLLSLALYLARRRA